MGVKLLFRTLKHVAAGDEKYMRHMSEFDEDADCLQIRHNGNTDYGKIVYVIKENTGYDGFCATLIYVIYFLLFAKEHGFATLIKMSPEFAYFDKEKSKEISNPWEYYFLPSGNSYDENKALNVCYCNYLHRDQMRKKYNLSPYNIENYYDESKFGVCLPLIRDYLVIKPDITDAAKAFLNPVTGHGGKILGVHFRGTDYTKGYNNHPVFVNEEQTIEEIKKAFETGKFEAVFLATDDAGIYDRIHEAIPDIDILFYSDVFRSSGDQSVAFSESERKYHKYLLGYEIVRDMYTLSLCDGLVAGKSSVGFLSNLYKHSRDEEYEYLKIIDNGNNLNDNEYGKK